LVSLPELGGDTEPSAELEDTSSGGGVAVLGVLALAALSGVACWYVREGPAPKKPSPDIFTLATLPASPPAPATPVPEKPGAKDFEEGRRLLASGDAARAIPFLSRAVGTAPGNALFHDVLGQALVANGAQDLAFGQFAEAARLDRDRFGRRLAERLADAGRNGEAARAYEQVLTGTPDDPIAQEGLGRMHYRLGNYARAVPLLQRAVKARSDDPVLQQELGYALQSTGDIKGAIDVYRSVLALAPGAEIARGLLADLVYEEGKPDDAIALVQEGLQRDPKSALLRTRLGSLLEQSGRPREAAEQYREYAHLAPNAPDAKELADRAERLEASSGGS
jgi:Flp pilus assembly protein TadD